MSTTQSQANRPTAFLISIPVMDKSTQVVTMKRIQLSVPAQLSDIVQDGPMKPGKEHFSALRTSDDPQVQRWVTELEKAHLDNLIQTWSFKLPDNMAVRAGVRANLKGHSRLASDPFSGHRLLRGMTSENNRTKGHNLPALRIWMGEHAHWRLSSRANGNSTPATVTRSEALALRILACAGDPGKNFAVTKAYRQLGECHLLWLLDDSQPTHPYWRGSTMDDEVCDEDEDEDDNDEDDDDNKDEDNEEVVWGDEDDDDDDEEDAEMTEAGVPGQATAGYASDALMSIWGKLVRLEAEGHHEEVARIADLLKGIDAQLLRR